MAHVSLGLGDLDQAIAWLQKAAEERDALVTFADRIFFVDPFRPDPRFQALLRRMKFPETAATGYA